MGICSVHIGLFHVSSSIIRLFLQSLTSIPSLMLSFSGHGSPLPSCCGSIATSSDFKKLSVPSGKGGYGFMLYGLKQVGITWEVVR